MNQCTFVFRKTRPPKLYSVARSYTSAIDSEILEIVEDRETSKGGEVYGHAQRHSFHLSPLHSMHPAVMYQHSLEGLATSRRTTSHPRPLDHLSRPSTYNHKANSSPTKPILITASHPSTTNTSKTHPHNQNLNLPKPLRPLVCEKSLSNIPTPHRNGTHQRHRLPSQPAHPSAPKSRSHDAGAGVEASEARRR